MGFFVGGCRGKFVDDLSTEETTALFRDEFARKWNRGKLARMFYEGLPDAVLEQTKRTRHRWGFVDKLGERERFDLATAKDSVDVATRKEDLLNVHAGSNSRARGPMPAAQDEAKRKRKASDDAGEEEEKDEAWRRRKSERKRQREDRDSVLDELAPKATGREAQLEKRRQVGQKLHGAARDREDARDGLDLSEEFIMGGGRGGAKDDDFQRRLAQRDSTRRRKEEERREKLAGLAAKESARMDKFLADMGLAGANGGKPMTIAPRR
ncbi:hypothetical protein BBJ28_00011015 [Nothophytophthora sp. Chile5]|nr:hypothetical protein BBJ28_00011015 [Nothophytophthora sp. Chile5]